MLGDTTAIHPAVREYLATESVRARVQVSAIVERHGITRQRLHQLLQAAKEKGLVKVPNTDEPQDISPSEREDAKSVPHVQPEPQVSEPMSGNENE